MYEEKIAEAIKELQEEMGSLAGENVLELATIIIKKVLDVDELTQNQVNQCVFLEYETGEDVFNDIINKYHIDKTKLKVINTSSEIIGNLGAFADIVKNIARIYRDIDENGIEGNAPSLLADTFGLLSDAIGFIPGAQIYSTQLSIAKTILEDATEMVNQRVAMYNELEEMLDDVMEGDTKGDSANELINIYTVVTNFENSGTLEDMKFYNALVSEFGWLYDMAGVDTTELDQYTAQIASLESKYNQLKNQAEKVETLCIDAGLLTVDDVGVDDDKIGESKETPENKDPLILDLNRNGKFSSTTDEGVHFDFEGDGFAEKTAWMEEGDGLLVFDRNANGLIDDGKELFGDKTELSDGTTASNGFVALEELDSNGDRIIDANDENFSDLRVWIDTNHDGISQEGLNYKLENYFPREFRYINIKAKGLRCPYIAKFKIIIKNRRRICSECS